jgi:S-formylglutathione hydrolase
MNVKMIKSSRTFEGETSFYEHDSLLTKTRMKFAAFLPQVNALENKKIDSAIIWLSGLTCTEENFITKAGVQRFLSGTKTMIICPDTSPRGLHLPGEHERYDFGSGAGFYVNALTEGYRDHYQMYDYVVVEIVQLLQKYFGAKKISIMGHSMGGHGALVMGLREQKLFTSVSAFSPLAHPMACDWGRKALAGYLGENEEFWKKYDATELLKSGSKRVDSILVDQGTSDEFLAKNLLPEHLIEAAKKSGQRLDMRWREGFDHSYYYISTFLAEHIAFHLGVLQ